MTKTWNRATGRGQTANVGEKEKVLASVSRFHTSAFCLVPFALTLFLSTSCGYSLAGRGSFLPDYIKIIGIPQFVNQTVVFDLDRVVTAQVLREFATHGH